MPQEPGSPVDREGSGAITRRIVDLSHEIVDGMITHPGLPGPSITTYLSRDQSAGRYAPGTTFEIARIDIVANTGTYLDTPAHRFAGGFDLAALALERVAGIPGTLADCRNALDKAIGPEAFADLEIAGRAVLVATGWDAHWGTPAYLADNPYLTEAACRWLVDQGVGLAGIDSLNVDSLADLRRPAHTILLEAGIPLVEYVTGLGALPRDGWSFFAVPPRIRGMATFPVRAFAVIG